jgi:uncharacterized integral membrane protein
MTSSVPSNGPIPVPEVAPAGATQVKPRRRVSPKTILVLVIIAIVLWFLLANTKDAQIKLWVKEVSAPVWLVLLCTFAAGVITGALLRRRRRRV